MLHFDAKGCVSSWFRDSNTLIYIYEREYTNEEWTLPMTKMMMMMMMEIGVIVYNSPFFSSAFDIAHQCKPVLKGE